MSAEGPSNSLQSYYSYQRQVARRAFAAAVMVGLVVYVLGYAAVAKGLVLGALFSVLNFVLMAHVLPHQVGSYETRKKATGMAFLSVAFRFGLLAIPLIVGLKSTQFRFWAVVVGLFTVQLGILFEHLVVRRWVGVESTHQPGA